MPSLSQAPDDAADGADVKEDDDEIEIVPQQYKEEAESQDKLEVVEDTEPAKAAMVEARKMPPDVRALTHIETKCFTMPFGNRETFSFHTGSTIYFAMPFGNRETFCFSAN